MPTKTNKATAPFNINKFKAQLKREFDLSVRSAMGKITKADMEDVGDLVIYEMRTQIKKGLSPIAGNGRFAAYKWAGRANALSKAIRRTRKGSKSKAKNKVLLAGRKKVESFKKTKYPYNMKEKFPNKKERPVNLELKGWFLDKLERRVDVPNPYRKILLIGFWDELASKYEDGHRVGVNGQPSRPIVPIKGEDFNQSVYKRLVNAFLFYVKRRL